MAKKSRKSVKQRQNRAALAGSAVLALIASISVGLYFAGVFDSVESNKTAEMNGRINNAGAQAALDAPYFHAFPEMVVDLRTAHCRAPFLRFTLVVQINEKDQPLIEAYEVRLTDRIQNHIRGYERRELVGIEGANRIRADMVNVINDVIGQNQVEAALFNNFILH